MGGGAGSVIEGNIQGNVLETNHEIILSWNSITHSTGVYKAPFCAIRSVFITYADNEP